MVKLENIVFYDEKIFTIELLLNKQNDRVWLMTKSSVDADMLRVTRRQKHALVLVGDGINEISGATPLMFVPQSVRINAQKYQELILEGCLKLWAQSYFGKMPFTFQQDSAKSHNARTTQICLQANFPSFIKATEWPPYSPHLNPLDFVYGEYGKTKFALRDTRVWSQSKMHGKKSWNENQQEVIRDSVTSFNERLKLLIKSKGGYFENLV